MRMRKKSWAIPYLQDNPNLVIQNPEINKGNWNKVLNRELLHLEIGMGKGDYFEQMSRMYPEEGWIGIEKEQNVAAIAAKKLNENPMDNRLMITKDAKDILSWFNEKEIDIIHLNFSDPWPKKSTRKRRLSHENFVKQYHSLLKDDGKVIMKTDNSKLFEFSLVEFTHNQFELEEVFVDFRKEERDFDAISEYEAKFIELNQPIYRAVFKKVVAE